MALVTLLAHTPQPELHVAAAAKLCYSPSSIDKIKEGLTEEKVASFVLRASLPVSEDRCGKTISFQTGSCP